MSDFPPDPLSVIDQLVSRFRNDWRAGKRPKIEEYLDGTPELEGHELFRAFLIAELHERRMQGEAPSSDEYHCRFRQYSELVAEEFTDTQKSMADSSQRERSRPDRESRADAIGATGGDVETLADRYRILDRLGAGAFGTVYKAQDTRLDRLVALKTPNFGMLGSEGDAQRFLREARAAGQLRHPNIVPVYDAGKIGDSYFIASGLIEGQTLADSLATKGKPLAREAAELVQKLALALHYAHTQGIIHRDVKPANVMIDATGQPLIMDFGMARRDEGEELRTEPGMLIGTPAYMSPEQHAGQSHLADARSDQWALGVILYEMLAGQRPFQAIGDARINDAVRETEPAHPTVLDRSISRDLGTICLKCLQKDPENRYPSCQVFAEDLGRWLRGEPITARPVRRIERAWRWCRRNPVVAGLSLAATVLLLAVGLVAGVGYRSTSRALGHSEFERKGKQDAIKKATAEQERANFLDEKAKVLDQQATAFDQQARRNLYFDGIDSAYSKWLACEPDAAERELDACPRELRHWEWGYLKRLCHLELQTVRIDSEEMAHVAVSANGNRIAIANRSRGKDKIIVCDAATGKQIPSLGEQKTPIDALAISPDGEQVATMSYDDPIRIWDVAAGKAAASLQRHAAGGGSLAFSLDGKQVVCGNSKTVTIWTVSMSQEIRTLKTNGYNAVAFSPDGKRIATAGSNTVKIWDIETGTELLALHQTRLSVRCVAFSPDGKQLAAGSGKTNSVGRIAEGENFVQVWDATTGKELVTLQGHVKGVTAVAFSSDGKSLVTGSVDRSVRIWNASKGQELTTLRGHNGIIRDVRFSPDAKHVISVSDDRTAKTWDTSDKQAMARYRNSFFVVSNAVFSPNGKRFALHSLDRIKICDTASGREEVSISVRITNRTGLAFSPDGKRIVSGNRDIMTNWDAATGHLEFKFPTERGGPTGIAFSPDGKYLASGSFEKNLDLWNAATGKMDKTLARGKLVASVAFSRDSKLLASAFYDGPIKIWDVDTGRETCTIRRSESLFVNAAFSPDGKRIVTGVGRLVRLFDTLDGKEVLTLRGHDSYVSSVAFSPDGKRIISGSGDFSIKIWDTASGHEVLTLRHSKVVTSVDFSSDGKRILTAGHGDGIKLWEAADWKGR